MHPLNFIILGAGEYEILNLQRKAFTAYFSLSMDWSRVHIFLCLSSKPIFILTTDFRSQAWEHLQPPDFYRSFDALFHQTTNVFAFLKAVEIPLKTQSRCRDACLNKQTVWHISSEVWTLILKWNFMEPIFCSHSVNHFPIMLRSWTFGLDEVKRSELNCCNKWCTEYYGTQSSLAAALIRGEKNSHEFQLTSTVLQ